MLVILNLPLVGLWVRLLAIPHPWLYAGILVFATIGTIGARCSVERDHARGVRPHRLRDAPLRLSDRARSWSADPRPASRAQFRRALSISLGDPLVLVQSPLSATLLGIAALALIAPFVLRGLGRFKADED